MTRSRLLVGAGALLLAVFVAWIASNTYWDDAVVPAPLKGEARTNPFYAAGELAKGLGASVSNAQRFGAPPPDSIIVLSSWHWNLTARRRQAVEQWVEAGGRLLVDSTLIGSEARFSQWTGVTRDYPRTRSDAADEADAAVEDDDGCLFMTDATRAPSGNRAPPRRLRVCGFGEGSYLRSARRPSWAMETARGTQVARVPIGRGSVTLINAAPFRYLGLLDGEHGRLFVEAAQLRRGDEILFLSEDEHPTLLTLMWQEGAPVVVLGLVLLTLGLWRGAMRFGPRIGAPERTRRSLAEQIGGSGQFALRYGGGEALHNASLRALGETATRRISGYAALTPDQRITALARATGVDAQTLAGAMFSGGHRRPHDLRTAIALLETLRRRLLAETPNPTYGTH